MLNRQDIRAAVHRQINDLREEAGLPVGPLAEDDLLSDLGMNSLLLSRLVVELETETGVDPFAEGEYVISDVRTVAALVDAYERTHDRAAVAA